MTKAAACKGRAAQAKGDWMGRGSNRSGVIAHLPQLHEHVHHAQEVPAAERRLGSRACHDLLA